MFTVMENLLLASLSAESRELIHSQCTPVTLPLRTVLYTAGNVPVDGYFLTSRTGLDCRFHLGRRNGRSWNRRARGPGGRDAFAGCRYGPHRVLMQLAGSALKIPFPKLQQLFKSSEEIRGRILEFVQEQTLSLSQLATCNRLHNAEERLARWLLMVDDRIQSDTIDLTQEFLAQMLGAQRTTVTMVAGTLQRAGLIEYKRGALHILNRKQLEAAACDCYGVTKKLYSNLYKK